MKSLNQQFPFNEGWIHAKLSLYAGHGLTAEKLGQQMNPKGTLEIGHVEITGNRAIVISREIKADAGTTPENALSDMAAIARAASSTDH